MLDGRSFNVVITLAPVRRRLGLAHVARWCLRGLGVGAVIGVVMLVAAHLWAPSLALLGSIAALAAGAVGGSIVGVRRWPDLLETARLADRHFALQDRLTTALELRTSQDPLSVLQRREAADRINGLRLLDSIRGQIGRRDPVVASLAIALLAGLMLLGPVPFAQKGGSGANQDEQRIRRAATRTVPALVHSLERGLTPQERKDPTMRKLDLALTQLKQQLARASTRPAALRAISSTQQQLHRTASSLHPIDAGTMSHLQQSLSKNPTTGQGTRSTSGDKGDQTTVPTMNRLAQSLQRLTPAQRSRLARALARTAKTSTDGRLVSPLQQASSALAANDPHAAARAMQRASGALARALAVRHAQQRLNKANSQLDALKNQIAGVAGESAARPLEARATPRRNSRGAPIRTGDRGAGQGMGQRREQRASARGASGRSSGMGRSKRAGAVQGEGRAAGQGTGQGRGSDVGSSYGGGGGHGLGGGRDKVGSRGTARYTTVYIPGREGRGPRTTETDAGGTRLGKGRIIPYQRVITRYSHAAHAALGRAALPPLLESYVRHYFDKVSR